MARRRKKRLGSFLQELPMRKGLFVGARQTIGAKEPDGGWFWMEGNQIRLIAGIHKS